jgi:hypothetical protein
MQISKLFFLLAAGLVVLTACGKDDSPRGLTGTWEGAWGFDNDTPTYYERWVIEGDGDMRAYDDDGDVVGVGEWSVDGFTFTAVYTPPGKDYSYTFEGLYQDQVGEITGTWGETPSSADGGTFEMQRND